VTIPEGSESPVTPSPPSIALVTDSMRELAASVANKDPSYQKSEENPFYTNARYRSMRKMKPREMTTGWEENHSNINNNNDSSPSCAEDEADYIIEPLAQKEKRPKINTHLSMTKLVNEHGDRPAELDDSAWFSAHRTGRIRSFSLPSSFVYATGGSTHADRRCSTKDIDGRHFGVSMLKKMSITLGLGEQRDLQGQIIMKFRDYDQVFRCSVF